MTTNKINGGIPNFFILKKIIKIKRDMLGGAGLQQACANANITPKQYNKAMKIVNRGNNK